MASASQQSNFSKQRNLSLMFWKITHTVNWFVCPSLALSAVTAHTFHSFNFWIICTVTSGVTSKSVHSEKTKERDVVLLGALHLRWKGINFFSSYMHLRKFSWLGSVIHFTVATKRNAPYGQKSSNKQYSRSQLHHHGPCLLYNSCMPPWRPCVMKSSHGLEPSSSWHSQSRIDSLCCTYVAAQWTACSRRRNFGWLNILVS